MNEANIAIIPARGGSTRIPRKNIKLFHGKPIIAYSIQAALNSGMFRKVIVSTDDEEIASISRMYGAITPFIRPANISDSFTGLQKVIDHTLDWLANNDSTSYKAYCMIYATAPLINVNDILTGKELLDKHQALATISMSTMPFPAQRSYTVLPEGNVVPLWPEFSSIRSQDLPESLQDAGQFNWVSIAKLKDHYQDKLSLRSNIYPVMIPRYRVQDIDTPEDWEVAELMYKALELKKEG